MFRFFRRNKIISQPTGIEIRQNAREKKGVFASRPFKPGQIIEEAPVILLDAAEREFLQSTSLFNYYFIVNKSKACVALGLGYSSLYNHAPKANAVYSIALGKAVIRIKAFRMIQEGEEITLNYNGLPDDETPVYFRQEASP